MEFSDFLRANGFLVRDVVPDSKWYRCGTSDKPHSKNGAYKLFNCGTVGLYQNHAIDSDVLTWKSGRTLSNEEKIISRQKVKESLERDRKIALDATIAAREYLKTCLPLRNSHQYLANKFLTVEGTQNIRLDAENNLIVPVFVKDYVSSLQKISQDGNKRFWTSAPTKAGYIVIGSINAPITLFCEGYATGLCLYQSVPNCRVIVCFNAGNIFPVIDFFMPTLRGLTAICADNDLKTFEKIGKNVGLDAAKIAASKINAGVAIPTCDNGSDFNDMLIEIVADLLDKNERLRERDKKKQDEIIKIAKMRVSQCVMRELKYVKPLTSKIA